MKHILKPGLEALITLEDGTRFFGIVEKVGEVVVFDKGREVPIESILGVAIAKGPNFSKASVAIRLKSRR